MKGDNAQQVIDLSATVKQNEAQLAEKQSMILALEAELVGVRDDLKSAELQIIKVEVTIVSYTFGEREQLSGKQKAGRPSAFMISSL